MLSKTRFSWEMNNGGGHFLSLINASPAVRLSQGVRQKLMDHMHIPSRNQQHLNPQCVRSTSTRVAIGSALKGRSIHDAISRSHAVCASRSETTTKNARTTNALGVARRQKGNRGKIEKREGILPQTLKIYLPRVAPKALTIPWRKGSGGGEQRIEGGGLRGVWNLLWSRFQAANPLRTIIDVSDHFRSNRNLKPSVSILNPVSQARGDFRG